MKQLLLIEDDPKIAEIERDYLEANGFSVTHIADGKVSPMRSKRTTR